MRFMVLVKADKNSEAGVMPSRELLTAMGNFNEELVKAGVMLAGDGLQPSSKGARVRFDGKKRTVIDGPFSETKELIAGFWIWNVKSPVAVGVPEMRPVEGLMERPAGSAPESTDHVCVPPPVAVSWRLYGWLAAAPPSELCRCTMLRPGTMVIENCRSVDFESAHQNTPPSEAGMSFIEIQNVHSPSCCGVPLIRPLDDMESPGGRALPRSEYETKGTQPVPSRPVICSE